MADSSQNRRYNRITRALMRTLSRNGWEAYNNGDGGVNIVTNSAANRIEQTVTHKGRTNAIQRAASGQSAG